MKKKSNPEISIFPNPSSGVFYISEAEGCQITVFDILGNKVYYTPSGASQKICINELGSGNYTVQIIDNEGLVSYHKVIVLK